MSIFHLSIDNWVKKSFVVHNFSNLLKFSASQSKETRMKEWMKQTGDIEDHVFVPRAGSCKVASVITTVWLSYASDDEHAQGAVMWSENPESFVPQN